MSIEALNWCKDQECPTPTSKLILFVLANYADQNFSCFPSEAHLAKICGVSDRSVRRSLSQLAKMNLIDIHLRKGTSNRYVMRVDASVQSRVDTSGRTGRPRASAYTKHKHKRKVKRRSLNELAG